MLRAFFRFFIDIRCDETARNLLLFCSIPGSFFCLQLNIISTTVSRVFGLYMVFYYLFSSPKCIFQASSVGAVDGSDCPVDLCRQLTALFRLNANANAHANMMLILMLMLHPVLGTASNAEGAGSSEISSCNYPARAKGVKAGMFMMTAKDLCPELVVLRYTKGRLALTFVATIL